MNTQPEFQHHKMTYFLPNFAYESPIKQKNALKKAKQNRTTAELRPAENIQATTQITARKAPRKTAPTTPKSTPSEGSKPPLQTPISNVFFHFLTQNGCNQLNLNENSKIKDAKSAQKCTFFDIKPP